MKKLYQWYCKVEEAAVGTGFIALILLVLASVVIRLLKISMSWSIDLAMLLLAWTAFLGADCAWRGGQIMGVDILTRQFPKKVRHIIEFIVLLIILATLIIIVIFGIRLAWVDRLERYQSMPIPYALVTISLIVAACSMVFSTLQKIVNVVNEIRGKDKASVQTPGPTASVDKNPGETGSPL